MSTIPSDGQLWEIIEPDGSLQKIVLFEPAPGVRIIYTIPNPESWDTSGRAYTPIRREHVTAFTYAGSADELSSYVQGDETYGQFWNKLIDQLFGPNDPARNDPSVLQAISQFAARPDMGESELMTLLERTPYWQARTDQQRRWAGLSPAEQEFQVSEWMTRLSDMHFQIFGATIDNTDPRLRAWAVDVAAGHHGESFYRGTFQRWALQQPESPWARQVRDEREQQLQRGVDIENANTQVRDLARRWGVQMTDQSLNQWARGIIENTSSQEDLLAHLKQQAQVLYAWKDPEMETLAAAEPWLQTYARVLERPADLFNAQIQSALTAGTPAFEFEKQLKQRPEWLETGNANESFQTVAGTAGRLMGFT